MSTYLSALCIASLLFSMTSFAGETDRLIQKELDGLLENAGYKANDLLDWEITDQYTSGHNQVTHVYIRQRHQGIGVFNGVANFNIWNGTVFSMNHDFVPSLDEKINTTQPVLTPEQAISSAADQLNLAYEQQGRLLEQDGQHYFLFDKGDLSLDDIPVVPMYQPMDDGSVRLAWDLSIHTRDAKDWWSIRVDAVTGEILHKNNWVTHCSFGHPNGGDHPGHVHTTSNAISFSGLNANSQKQAPDSYNVFALPVESPNHGPRTLVVDPADAIASPYGWHDTNGVAGAEFTITRGNNVLASEDVDDDNQPGFSPDGGATLDFDWPLNFNQQPAGYQDAAITNLFYMNNMMHDIWYRYGFDEVSGNFQENNYGNGGAGGDYVNADAQDGGGTNNANFGTPPDGSNPRMQMFLWTTGGGAAPLLTINTPSGIAGPYNATQAGFGPGVPTSPLTADLVLADDGVGPNVNDCCEPITNGADLNGKIAVIDRGDCTFVFKVEAAQNEGAIAVIIVNNVATAPITMGGASGTITIPSIMVSQSDGNAIKAVLNGGNPVNGTLQDTVLNGNFDIDGDFDNGIIAHEYGHGISNRLTGGPSNTGCLSNAEQMGEGWSDYFAIIMTIEPGDTATDVRGVGTFAIDEPTTGGGIRPAPYTTDFSINPYTYASTNNTGSISQPHGIGFVWCTMLWDLTWAFIDLYGFDPDLYSGTGGNNMAAQLVMDGMKLQACSPGFVDGRDAILEADQILNGGAHRCLIWEVFANRGLGFSADQGSSSSRSDQVEAFDLPPFCQTAVVAPTAAFTPSAFNTCYTTINFEDQSSDIPQQWNWDFGDGNTSQAINPSHTYQNPGVYVITLIVTNTVGADTATETILITSPDAPVTADGEGCVDDSVQLSASGSGEIRWFDDNGNQVAVGNTFWTPQLTTSTTYQAQNVEVFPSTQVGPIDNTFGGGGYHGTGFTGTVDFTAHQPLEILSAWVDAEYPGPRDLFLWDGNSATGAVLQQVTVDIPFTGPGRIDLGFEVPSAGEYSIGGTGVDLFRNNNSANYPYSEPGLMTITGSSAGPDFYYYLYDLEVAQAPCKSSQVPVVANIVEADFTFSVNDKTITLIDNSSGAVSWSWSFGDGATSTLENPVHVYINEGVYTITLEINGGDCIYTQQIVIGPVGIDQADGPQVSMYPNPTADQVFFEFDGLNSELDLEVYSTDGRLMQFKQVEATDDQVSIDLSNYSSGVYMVKMTSEGYSKVERLVLQR